MTLTVPMACVSHDIVVNVNVIWCHSGLIERVKKGFFRTLRRLPFIKDKVRIQVFKIDKIQCKRGNISEPLQSPGHAIHTCVMRILKSKPLLGTYQNIHCNRKKSTNKIHVSWQNFPSQILILFFDSLDTNFTITSFQKVWYVKVASKC